MDRQTLLEDFIYDPATGLFIRRRDKGKWKQGNVAGCIDKHGYISISINGRKYKAHRLAFMYMLGSQPEIVDHVNGLRSDNRWCNLRSCDAIENASNRIVHKNNVLGIKGVAWVEARNRFTGTVTCKGVTKSNDFKSIAEAVEWVEKQRAILHKEFAK